MTKIKRYNPKSIKIARSLRKNSTPWERRLWSFLKSSKFYGFKFRRQYPIGKYIVDFCCIRKRLVIELDGGQHNEQRSLDYDENRDEFLSNQGYRVVRIWNSELSGNIEGVAEKIYQMLENPHP